MSSRLYYITVLIQEISVGINVMMLNNDLTLMEEEIKNIIVEYS